MARLHDLIHQVHGLHLIGVSDLCRDQDGLAGLGFPGGMLHLSNLGRRRNRPHLILYTWRWKCRILGR